MTWRPDPLAPPPRRVSLSVPVQDRGPVSCQCQGRTICPCRPCPHPATQEDFLCDECRAVPTMAQWMGMPSAEFLVQVVKTGVHHCH